MTPFVQNESDFEATTIERLKLLGYEYDFGPELRARPEFTPRQVVLLDALRRHLEARYPHLSPEAVNTAVSIASNPEGVDTLRRNMAFHEMLTRGFEVTYHDAQGRERYEHVHLVDWEHPEKNDFRVVNQLPIHGTNDRRPDLIIYVNGLPLVVFELKNPYEETPTVEGAHNQIGHYTVDIPQLFDFNAFCVISDGKTTLHGMHSASLEWFAPWKTIDGNNVEPTTTGGMKTLVEGLFAKDRLLDYIRNFIVFEVVNEVVTKKGAKYHQFFGVRLAVQQAIRATQPEGDRKIGVIWHTQGSGKSLSMIFLVGILRRRLNNPTFVVQVDRTDLDEQLYDFFVAAKSLVGDVQHAESTEELRELLQTEGGGIIFTTVEKFRLREGEREHPVLSERRNIIVIADEAHRTQYGFTPRVVKDKVTGERYTTLGFAGYLHAALPGASFIGFTGTPIDLVGRDTQAIFGEVIHTYDIPQAQADGAIVPIYYEARLVKLHLVNPEVDKELEEISESEEQTESLKAEWAAIEAAAGAKERLVEIARDIVNHYAERSEAIEGKAIVVCMSRRICASLFDEIVRLRPDWQHRDDDKGRIKIVMTGDLARDPKEWNEAGHITTKERREKLKARLRDPEDQLKIVIVRDMWLTGTDIPCLHTVYVDKPMKGHNLMQAIARVNRVFKDKPGGLVVDYIGIGTPLKEAASKFTASGYSEPAGDLDDEAVPAFERALEATRALLPGGVSVANWRRMSNIEVEDLCSHLYGHFAEFEEDRDAYLTAEKRLSSAYSLVSHLPEVAGYTDEVAFYQMIRGQLKKTVPGPQTELERKKKMSALIDRTIGSKGMVDIFEVAGLPKPDISILDPRFLQEFNSRSARQENLRVKLLEKLLGDEIVARQRKNLKKYRTFKEMLDDTLRRYHNNAITTAMVIQQMMEVRQQMLDEDRRKADTGLGDEELAFYDALAGLGEQAYDMPFLCDLVRDVVQSVKRNLKVDWTKPHREDVKSALMASVKMVLRRHKVKKEHFDFILKRVEEQAEALYADWPVVA